MTTAGQSWNKSEVGLTHAQIVSRQLARATVGYEVEADLGTFRERRKASPLDRRDMDEHILAAVIRLNKTIAFRGVEFESVAKNCAHFTVADLPQKRWNLAAASPVEGSPPALASRFQLSAG